MAASMWQPACSVPSQIAVGRGSSFLQSWRELSSACMALELQYGAQEWKLLPVRSPLAGSMVASRAASRPKGFSESS